MLKKSIGKKTLFLFMVNGVIGTGIYFLPALGVHYAGPASLLSWLIMSIVSVFMAFYFAELVSMFPRSGGVYEYVKKAFGEFPSFIAGWTSWIIANITIAMLIVGSLKFLFPNADMIFNMSASVLIILVFNFVSYRGMGWASKLLVFFGVATLASIFMVIIPGSFHVSPENFTPFFAFPLPVIFLALYFIAETFFGWEVATYLTEEVKDARKVLPRVLVISTIFIAIISILFVFVSIGVSDWRDYGESRNPSMSTASNIFPHEFLGVFLVLVFVPLIGTAASWIISSPRLLYAMSRDKVLVSRFQKLHPRFKTPHYAIFFQTLVTIVVTLIALGDFISLLYLLVPLAMIMYSIVVLSVTKLRYSMPSAKRHFRAPFGKAGPALITAFSAYLIYVWLHEVPDASYFFMLGIFFILFGIPLYVLIKLQTDKKFTEKFYDKVSFFWDSAFAKWYSQEETAKVVSKLRLGRKSVVLDFGCGSGFTTKAISQKASKVVAVDISIRQLRKAVGKAKKSGLHNVVFVKTHEADFPPGSFDALSAVGVLEHLDYPHVPVRRLMRMLKKGGRFSFLVFGRSFIFPAPEHFKDEESIRSIFPPSTEVHVKKERKLFTDYWYVWGVKH
jgi:APA family basic amino acid/polyamine antiporter/amino acid efflux transporter